MDEEAKLLITSNGKDADGYAIEKRQEIPIFVREKSATRSEFYEAMRQGITVRIMFEARIEDFELSAHMVGDRKEYASQIEYDGAVYDIVRTYKTDKSMIEIICS